MVTELTFVHECRRAFHCIQIIFPHSREIKLTMKRQKMCMGTSIPGTLYTDLNA